MTGASCKRLLTNTVGGAEALALEDEGEMQVAEVGGAGRDVGDALPSARPKIVTKKGGDAQLAIKYDTRTIPERGGTALRPQTPTTPGASIINKWESSTTITSCMHSLIYGRR